MVAGDLRRWTTVDFRLRAHRLLQRFGYAAGHPVTRSFDQWLQQALEALGDRALEHQAQGALQALETLLERLQRDLPSIGRRFGPLWSDSQAGGTLTEIQWPQPHGHAGGLRVAVLTFDSGKRLVYKPRDLRMDNALIGDGVQRDSAVLRLNTAMRPDSFALPMLAMHECRDARGPYGYVAWLPTGGAQDCLLTAIQGRTCLMQWGGWAALAALFGIRDLHYQNVYISAGEVYLIDVELALDLNQLRLLQRDLRRAEGLRAPPAVIGASRLLDTWTRTQRREDGTGPGPSGAALVTENLLAIEGLGKSRTADGRIDKVFAGRCAPYVAAGFETLAAAFVRLGPRWGDWARACDGLHVRYMPMVTRDIARWHRRWLVRCRTEAERVGRIADAVDERLAEKSARVGKRPPIYRVELAQVREGVIDDLVRGNVPYFTVGVTDGLLYHHGQPVARRRFCAPPLVRWSEAVADLADPIRQKRLETGFADSLARALVEAQAQDPPPPQAIAAAIERLDPLVAERFAFTRPACDPATDPA